MVSDALNGGMSAARCGDRRDVRAANVNTMDEVPDSTWFTNRIGRTPMSIEQLVRGPNQLDIVNIDGWPIVQEKSSGITPGYRVTDPSGHLYQVKFDPPSNPEMASGAEVILDFTLARTELGNWTNRVSASAAVTDPDVSNNLSTWITRIRLDADLEVAGSVVPGTIRRHCARTHRARHRGTLRNAIRLGQSGRGLPSSVTHLLLAVSIHPCRRGTRCA